jgi:hypothetical protein
MAAEVLVQALVGVDAQELPAHPLVRTSKARAG